MWKSVLYVVVTKVTYTWGFNEREVGFIENTARRHRRGG